MIGLSRMGAGLTAVVAGGFALAAIPGCLGRAEDPQDAARAAIRAFTEARTRIVWLQDQGEGRDAFATGTDLLIMALDTDEPGGPRPLLPATDNYRKPLITPAGDQVVFTNRREGRVYVASWDGSRTRDLCRGTAIQVWRDPADGVEWVYVADEDLDNEREPHRDLRRIRLDGIGPVEPVWNRTEISMNHLQISRDGTRAAGLFPWPQAGVLDLVSKTWQRHGRGCCVSMAPDNSYVFWIFDGAHRNLMMRSPTDGMRWRVPANQAPGMDGHKVFHPRWSNHVRYMAITGPYKFGEGGDAIRGGGTGVEIHLGRFSDDLGSIESWCRVTHNEKGDFFPDVWIETGPDSDLEREIAARRGKFLSEFADAAPVPDVLREEWPGSHENLVFIWKNDASQNEIRDPEADGIVDCRVEAMGRARYGRLHEMRPAGGWFRAPDAQDRLLEACRNSNEITLEAVLTPDSLDQSGPARIVSFSSGVHSRNFTLGQEGGSLVFRIRTPQTGQNGERLAPKFGAIRADAPHHVLVSYRPGTLACYLDGEPVLMCSEIQGGFENWEEQTLLFGNEVSGDRPWRGGLESIALFSGFVGPEQARHHYELHAADLADRSEPTTVATRGKLVAMTETPSPESILPYRRALGVYVYEILDPADLGAGGAGAPGPADGHPAAGDRVLVAHWIILDGETVPFDRRTGEAYELLIEPFDDHPQLEGERLLMNVDDYDLAMFVDVTE